MTIKRMWMHWLTLAFALLLVLPWPVSAPAGLPAGAEAFESRDYEPTCGQRSAPADPMHADMLTS